MQAKINFILTSIMAVLLPGASCWLFFGKPKWAYYTLAGLLLNGVLLFTMDGWPSTIQFFVGFPIAWVLMVMVAYSLIMNIKMFSNINNKELKCTKPRTVFSGILVLILIPYFVDELVDTPVGEKDWNTHSYGGVSMSPALRPSENVISWDNYYFYNNPQRCEIVHFYQKVRDSSWIRYMIGIPGDTIFYNDDEIVVVKASKNENAILELQRGNFTKLLIPDHKYFMVGSTLIKSRDSRYKSMSLIDRTEITGLVTTVYWSDDFSRIGIDVSQHSKQCDGYIKGLSFK